MCFKSMRTLAMIALAIASITSAQAGDRLDAERRCKGILVHDDSGYSLKPDAGSLSWCDAEISNDALRGSVRQILDVCKVGGGCEITGVTNGHGAFYWVKLSSVRSLPSRKFTPGDSIGWVKSTDIDCHEDDTCDLKNNYTQAGCAVFGIPVYNRPNGTPIAELVSEKAVEGVVRGEQHQGFTFVSVLPGREDRPTMAYNPKSLSQCG
jgi:hypothetical protein